MTVEEVLRKTAEMLNAIPVPVGLREQIAEPIGMAINNLNLCLEAIAEQQKAKGTEKAEAKKGVR